jgi:hypothetical protein
MMVGGTHEGRSSKRDVKVDLGIYNSLLRIHFKRVNVCFVFPCVWLVRSKMPLYPVVSLVTSNLTQSVAMAMVLQVSSDLPRFHPLQN